MTIDTPRLLLREFVESDWRAVHTYASIPEVVQFETWGPNSETETQFFVNSAIGFQNEKPRRTFEFAIILKSDQSLIGGCGIRIKNDTNRDGDLGFTIHSNYWGKGLGTEVANSLISFGFDNLKLHRIWVTCNVKNLASARVLEKSGMKLEGTLRKNLWQRTDWRDSFLYAILDEDQNLM